MLKITIGYGYGSCFTTEGTVYDDLMGIVDEYVQEHPDEFAKYDYAELADIYDGDEDIISENSTPINGGEYYIGPIAHVEEV